MSGAPQRVMPRPAPRPDRVDRLCGMDEVADGEVKRVKIDGRPPLAVFNLGGEFFVTDDTCTHGMASLSEGLVDGGVIECPWHGGAFDVRTGAPARHPCSVALRCYTVELRDGAIYAGPARKAETGGGQA